MPRAGRRTERKGGTRRAWALVALAAAGAVAWLVVADEEAGAPAARTLTPVAGPADLHGLAVHPEDPSTLYAATHTGLLVRNASGWFRVGSSEDDLMGFSVHPTDGDVLWASGHPPRGPNLGVVKSADGGATWTRIALPGVDFHAMTVSVADPDRLWGYFQGRLYRSDDGGHDWRAVNEEPPVPANVAADPADADVLWLAGPDGLWRSADAGASFARVRDDPLTVVGVARHDGDVLVVGARERLERSSDGGASWTPLDAPLSGLTPGFVAHDPSDARTWYVGTFETAILATADDGASWAPLAPP